MMQAFLGKRNKRASEAWYIKKDSAESVVMDKESVLLGAAPTQWMQSFTSRLKRRRTCTR
jgi:hypothetical protein